MANESKYQQRDIQFIERLYLLGLKEYLLLHPANTEVDFLEETIATQRAKVDALKTEFYERKDINKTATTFYRENLKRQHIYLDLLMEKKKAFERKRLVTKKSRS